MVITLIQTFHFLTQCVQLTTHFSKFHLLSTWTWGLCNNPMGDTSSLYMCTGSGVLNISFTSVLVTVINFFFQNWKCLDSCHHPFWSHPLWVVFVLHVMIKVCLFFTWSLGRVPGAGGLVLKFSADWLRVMPFTYLVSLMSCVCCMISGKRLANTGGNSGKDSHD